MKQPLENLLLYVKDLENWQPSEVPGDSFRVEDILYDLRLMRA
jgi:hypothetical protein